MKAHQRDRIVFAANRFDAPTMDDRIVFAANRFDAPTMDGEVLEIDGEDGEPPYLVRWADGRLCPESDLVLEFEDQAGTTALAEVILLSEARASHPRK